MGFKPRPVVRYFAAVYDGDVWGLGSSYLSCLGDADNYIGQCDAPLAEQLEVIEIGEGVDSVVQGEGGCGVADRLTENADGCWVFQ